jgi:hypothetical protein
MLDARALYKDEVSQPGYARVLIAHSRRNRADAVFRLAPLGERGLR